MVIECRSRRGAGQGWRISGLEVIGEAGACGMWRWRRRGGCVGSETAGCGWEAQRSAPLPPWPVGTECAGPIRVSKLSLSLEKLRGPCRAGPSVSVPLSSVMWAGACTDRWLGEAGLSVARVPALLTGPGCGLWVGASAQKKVGRHSKALYLFNSLNG